MQPWLKDLQVRYEIRCMQRRRLGREIFASVRGWFPFWLVLTAALLIPWRVTVPIFMALPVLMLSRYFLLRRRAETLLQKIYEIVRLNHPLADNLAAAGMADHSMLGVRMAVMAEALRRGMTIHDALRFSAPEVRRNDLAALAVAEQSGRLLPELAHLADCKNKWPFLNDVDSAYGIYLLMVLLVLVAAVGFVAICDFHIFHDWLASFGASSTSAGWAALLRTGSNSITEMLSYLRSLLPPRPQRYYWYPSQGAVQVLLLLPGVLLVLFAMVWSVFLRRTIHPFFRRERLTKMLRDAILWRAPVVGALIRWRCWAEVSELLSNGITAGTPLPDLAGAAIEISGNRSAQRRLRAWRDKLTAGVPPARAAHEAGFPQLLRQALGSSGTTIAASLRIGACYYRIRLMRRRQVIRALSIPASVLVVGLVVLLVALALYVPYTQVLSAAAGGGS
jgi:type II secretory pathway component PulF